MKTTEIISRTVLTGALALQAGLSDAQPLREKEASEAIRPYHVQVSSMDIKDLRRRVQETRWPDMETVADHSQGAKLAELKGLVQYWGTDYDWKKAEAKLNAYPQFITNIDGVDIHFIHVRSKDRNAMPLLLTHGWPGSVFEFIKVIDPLTNPTAFGGKGEDAFDVIIPSLPGFGFSGKPTEKGWDIDRIGKAWSVLMNRLGYKRYVAQGGDWGAGVVNSMALQAPAGLLAIHSNLPATLPNDVAKSLGGAPLPAGMSAQEQSAFETLANAIKGGGFTYKMAMQARPQGVSYGLTNSPAGLAAWFLLHPGFSTWSFGADPKQYPTKDEVLDDISLYWLTNTVTSSARIYWENSTREIVSAGSMKTDQITLPVAVSVFPEDVFRSPETWARRAYRNLIYFNEVDKGGHFASWEQPQLFTEELRMAFKSLR